MGNQRSSLFFMCQILSLSVCLSLWLWLRACVCVCARARVCVCVFVCVRACVCMSACDQTSPTYRFSLVQSMRHPSYPGGVPPRNNTLKLHPPPPPSLYLAFRFYSAFVVCIVYFTVNVDFANRLSDTFTKKGQLQ